MKYKKVLLTGASGFIGSALSAHLATRHIDLHIIGLGRQSRRIKNGSYIKLDLLDVKKLQLCLSKHRPQVIIHLAGGRYAGMEETVSSNILTTVNLFKALGAVSGYRPRVLVIGSAAEYGDRPFRSLAVKESSKANPLVPYGKIKLMQTRLALQFVRQGHDVCVARLFNIIGPGVPQDTAAGRFAAEIVSRQSKVKQGVIQVSDLEGVRDFLDIRDICEALYQIAVKGRCGEIYNICSSKGIKMRDLLNLMLAAAKDSAITYKEDKTKKPGIRYSVGSNAKLKRATGWKPKFSLAQSIQDTLQDYQRTVS